MVAAASDSFWQRLLSNFSFLFFIVLLLTWSTRPDGKLHIFFFDTPGDAFLLQTPNGQFILLDGGADPTLLALQLGRKLPFWQRKLDAILLTQNLSKCLPGQVAALARYQVKLALVCPNLATANPSSQLDEWKRLLAQQKTKIRLAKPGDRLAFPMSQKNKATKNQVLINVLLTGAAENSGGMVLRLDYGHFSMVFASATNEFDDEQLLKNAQPVTVLVYPWVREMDTKLMAGLKPRYILFSSLQESQEPALLTYYEREAHYGSKLYHPSLDGTIELITNGLSLQIKTEKKASKK